MTENNKDFEYAGFWIRLWAYIIDSVLYSALIQIIMIPILFFSDFHLFIDEWIGITALDSGQYNIETFFKGFIFISFVNFFVLVVLYGFVVILFWIYYQATPGKMAIRGKIVDAQTGNKPSTAQFIGRYFAYIPSICIFGIGILWIAFDRRKQGWHDKLTGTIVIKEKNYVQDVQFKIE